MEEAMAKGELFHNVLATRELSLLKGVKAKKYTYDVNWVS